MNLEVPGGEENYAHFPEKPKVRGYEGKRTKGNAYKKREFKGIDARAIAIRECGFFINFPCEHVEHKW